MATENGEDAPKPASDQPRNRAYFRGCPPHALRSIVVNIFGLFVIFGFVFCLAWLGIERGYSEILRGKPVLSPVLILCISIPVGLAAGLGVLGAAIQFLSLPAQLLRRQAPVILSCRSLEEDFDPRDSRYLHGWLLARHLELLDNLAVSGGVTPLYHFGAGCETREFFSSQSGIETITFLKERIPNSGIPPQDIDRLIDEIKKFEKILHATTAFRLSLSHSF